MLLVRRVPLLSAGRVINFENYTSLFLARFHPRARKAGEGANFVPWVHRSRKDGVGNGRKHGRMYEIVRPFRTRESIRWACRYRVWFLTVSYLLPVRANASAILGVHTYNQHSCLVVGLKWPGPSSSHMPTRPSDCLAKIAPHGNALSSIQSGSRHTPLCSRQLPADRVRNA